MGFHAGRCVAGHRLLCGEQLRVVVHDVKTYSAVNRTSQASAYSLISCAAEGTVNEKFLYLEHMSLDGSTRQILAVRSNIVATSA